MWPKSMVVLGFSAGVLACGPTLEDGGSGIIAGAEADISSVVALYTSFPTRIAGGETLQVVTGLGSGILLCPNAVLTAMHVSRMGTLKISNRTTAATWREVIVEDWVTHQREKRELLVAEPDPNISFLADLPTNLHLFDLPDRDRGLVPDGLSIIEIAPSFRDRISYPRLPSRERWNDRLGVAIGYGPERQGSGVDRNSDMRTAGTRRAAALPFLGPANQPSLLTFDGGVLIGDSGGPLLGSGEWGDELAGTSVAVLGSRLSPSSLQSLVIDVAAHQQWVREVRDRICGRQVAAWDPPPDGPGEPAPAVDVAQGSFEDVELAAVETEAIGEGESVVCVCEGPCEDSCPEAEQEPVPPDLDPGEDRAIPEGWSCGEDLYADDLCDCGCGADDAEDCAGVGCAFCWEDGYEVPCTTDPPSGCSCVLDDWCEEYWNDEEQDSVDCECDPDCSPRW